MALQIILRRLHSRRCLARGIALLGCWLMTVSFTYKLAVPGRKLTFPASHYAHPDFKTEWWYYTGQLATDSGKRYGYQVTFFRFGLRDRQKDSPGAPLFRDLYMAHFALTDIAGKKMLFRERINRGFAGNAAVSGSGDKAGAATDRYLVWNEDWKVSGDGSHHAIEVNERGTHLRLSLNSLKAPVLHGDKGLSQKDAGEGRASYYYSLTRMQTDGELTFDGKKEKVRGVTWMDHEFGSNQLGADQVGWDWFSIQLDNDTELMLYLMRRKDGSVDPHSSGTLIGADGTSKHLALKDFQVEVLERWKSAKSGANYPMKWRVTLPSEQIELEISPAFAEQELGTQRSTRVTYWEGAVRIRAKVRGQTANGAGYVEMTGYAGKLTI